MCEAHGSGAVHLSTAETANMVPVWPDAIAFLTCLSHSERTQALMTLVLFTLSFQPSHPLSSDPPTLPPAHAPQTRTLAAYKVRSWQTQGKRLLYVFFISGGSTVVAVASRPL